MVFFIFFAIIATSYLFFSEELQAAIEEYEKKKGDEVAEEVTSKTVKSHASPKRKSRDPDPLVTINSYEEALNNVKAQVSIKIDQ